MGFGIATFAMGYVKIKSAAYAGRFILGIFEAGMYPGTAYYLSRWYGKSELTFRLAIVMSMSPVAGIIGCRLASGNLNLDHFGTKTRWRMIFATEVIISIGFAIVLFVLLRTGHSPLGAHKRRKSEHADPLLIH